MYQDILQNLLVVLEPFPHDIDRATSRPRDASHPRVILHGPYYRMEREILGDRPEVLLPRRRMAVLRVPRQGEMEREKLRRVERGRRSSDFRGLVELRPAPF